MEDHSDVARGTRAFVVESQAAEILGEAAVITIGQARYFWEADEKIHRLDSVPFASARLARCATENNNGHQWRLCYLLGTAPLVLLCKFPIPTRLITSQLGTLEQPDIAVIDDRHDPGFCMSTIDFIMKSRSDKWSFSPRPPGWRLIDLKPRYCRLAWDEQTTLLEAAGLLRAHDRDVLEAIFAIKGITGEDLLPYSTHWGFPMAPGRPPITVGTNSEGVYLASTIEAKVGFYDWLGVCAQISPEE